MNHLLNICNINGAEVEPVDIIIFGAPCQDLSVAGKRSGMKHEVLGDNETTRSGLFFEAIRIIKEMRESTNGEYPKYAVYENVPGAFSSNKGRDFHAVLEALCSVCDDAASIPEPYDKKRTKLVWNKAGEIMGDNYSVAWRTLDAQYWGVPQRRRRIALVADFGGQSAPEILFKSDSVSGHFAESGAQGERVAGDVANCFRETGVGYWGEGVGALRAQPDGSTGGNVVVAGFCQGASPAAQTIGYQEEVSPTIKGVGTTEYLTGWDNQEKRIFSDRGVTPTLSGSDGGGGRTVCGYVFPINDKATRYQGGGATRNKDGSGNGLGIGKDGDPAPTLTSGDKHAVFDARGNGDGTIAPTMTGDHQNRVTDYTGIIAAVDCRNGTENPDINGTLQAKPNGGTSYNLQNTVRTHQSVRRLTPLECERLQGYPDNWTNIPPQTEVTAEDLSFWRTVWNEWDDMNGKKRHSDKQIIKWLQSEPADSARYKALGNSIALPPWRFVLSRIHKQGARTMASLFDGIGGFPKIWQELGGQTLWCSEVEPFPILVTRYHFKEVHNGK